MVGLDGRHRGDVRSERGWENKLVVCPADDFQYTLSAFGDLRKWDTPQAKGMGEMLATYRVFVFVVSPRYEYGTFPILSAYLVHRQANISPGVL